MQGCRNGKHFFRGLQEVRAVSALIHACPLLALISMLCADVSGRRKQIKCGPVGGCLFACRALNRAEAFKGAAFWQYIHSSQASLIRPNVLSAPTFC